MGGGGWGWGGVERGKKGGWVEEREKEEEKIDKKPQNTARQKEGMPSVHCSQAFVCEKKGLWFNSVFVQFCLREQASCHRTEDGGRGGGDVGDGGTGGRGDEGGGVRLLTGHIGITLMKNINELMTT